MTKDKPADAMAAAWSKLLGGLTAAGRAGLAAEPADALAVPAWPANDEAVAEYSAFRLTLTPIAQTGVDDLVDTEPAEPDPKKDAGRYCVVEAKDGEWPTVSMYKTSEGLARKLGAIAGHDTVAWCFFGIPLPFTQGGPKGTAPRHLILQDGESALAVPPYEGAPVRRVPADLISSLVIQEDGYVGPADLTISRPAGDGPEEVAVGDDYGPESAPEEDEED